MRMSSFGLVPYISRQDFRISIPNKAIEYLSAGLPVVSSLQGVLSDLFAETGAGRTYENRNSGQLAAILEEFDDDGHLLQAASSSALSLYRERFVAEKVYAEFQAYLEGIAETHVLSRAA